MQSTSEGCMNIAELANQLRREKIFITSERQQVQNLNEDVEKKALELLQVSWICSQQRQNLTNLLAARCEAESVVACQRASLLENTTFIDVYKVLNYKEANALAELLGWLRDSPHLMCLCLLLGEEHLPPSLPPALVAGLYGSCRSAGDRTRLLAVIRSLIKHQMAPLAEPRKLFRTGRGALASLYTVFRDGHTPARQFLIAALEGPVMSVLQEDEFYLDIDPDKSMERFSAADRLKKFGQPTSPEFATKVARYRAWVVQSLYNLTNQFICSLREHWSSFPASLAWILQQIVTLLKHHSRVSERELHALCTDVVLTQYVCAGVAAPDALGVADAGVSAVARSNLQQVAQLLQGLCLAKCQEVDPKARDLYSKFDRACVWSLVESALSGACAPAPPPAPAPPAPAAPRPPAHALLTHADAHCLVNYLKRISSKLNNNTPSVTSEDMSSGSGPIAEAAAFSESSSDSSSVSDNSVGRLMSLLQTVEPNYKSRLHDLLRRLPQLAQYRQSPQEYKEVTENGHTPKKGILAKVSKPRPPRSASPAHEERGDEGAGLAVVMLIKLPSAEDHEYIGLESEAKVLESYYGGSEAGDADDGGSALAVAAPTQKRTRFSVSHDEVSFGNTSDNLEAVSEAASNHSVTSSLELETEDQNDNLSDMVSANVSGRGSPNISGRETPSSQVTDGDAAPDATRRMPANAPISQGAANAQAKLLKQTRNDIEDKFCKFEIKKLLEGDETISIMSDTWSTDVLASDSETIGDGEQSQGAPSVASGGAATSTLAPDVSETASESAWSVDVLASDSDRNTEVDTDDCVSVAARSDSSWPRRASQPEELAVNKVLLQNGNVKRPEAGSPRHTSRPILPNRSGGVYLSATAAISRGGELDLSAAPYGDQRKSILVNGYPVSVMSCYAASASGPSADSFEYGPHSSSSALTESTLDGANSQSDATSQWVDDSFPPPQPSPERPFPSTSYDLPSTSKQYEEQDLMDRSLNSSESSFNHLSVSQYDRRFDSGIDTERQDSDSRSMITDLMTRMSSATISTSNLVNNITSRIIKSEIRTSIVSISSSRVDKRRELSNISLSTLSLNSGESASDRSSSQDVNSENVTERRVSPPPAKPLSTGAIPKSISFDATAEKSQRRRIIEDGLAGNLDELKHNVKRSGGSLLHKIRMFRQKARSQQNHHDVKLLEDEARSDDGSRDGPHETSEDILAKYRRKGSGDAGKRAQRRASDVPVELDNRPEGVVDLNDPEVFDSMKRRLRIILSNPDLHCVDYVPNRCTSTSIVEWVRCLCWSGGAGGEWGAAGAAHVWRALATAGQAGRLAGALRSDLAARRPYLAYLAACRHALAVAQTDLHQQIGMVRVESVSLSRAAAAARTRAQLERGGHLRRLAPPPHGSPPVGGELMDEKATRLIATIKAITAEVKADPSWDGATSLILETVEMTVERAAFARIYLHVMFPNGDGDIARDQVFSEHIRRQCAGASAARLGVAARHLWAAPFPRAQAALRALAACRTPRDKLSCVMRCVTCIMAALSLTDGTAPSADDLTPALVYVILKVNPPSLLSTVDLVSALGGAALAGEALYWWTQFCACVAYIKTLDFARS